MGMFVKNRILLPNLSMKVEAKHGLEEGTTVRALGTDYKEVTSETES